MTMTHAHRNRSGIASIEFLMGLSVIIAFSAATMYVVRVLRAKQQAQLLAESRTLAEGILIEQEKRLADSGVLEGKPSPIMTRLVQGFRPDVQVLSGVAVGDANVDSKATLYGNIPDGGSSYAAMGYLSHSWENEVFRFPSNESEQPMLTFPASIRGIDPKLPRLDSFQKLLHFSRRVENVDLGVLARRLGSGVSLGKKQFGADSKRLEKLEALLRAAEQNPLSHPQDIARLRQEIAELKSDLDRLSRALDLVN